MPFPHKNIRRPSAHYLGQRSYFVTLCCAARHPNFANPNHARDLIAELGRASAMHLFAVHAYCAMPDHFHALVTGLEPTSNLLVFLKHLKESTTRQYKKHSRGNLWQKKFHDHILRENDSLERIANYILMNPVRKGLCADPREYPFSGSLVHDWQKLILPSNGWVPEWKPKPQTTQQVQPQDQRPTTLQSLKNPPEPAKSNSKPPAYPPLRYG